MIVRKKYGTKYTLLLLLHKNVITIDGIIVLLVYI